MQIIKKIMLILFCFILTFASFTPTLPAEAATIKDVKTSDSKFTAISWAVDNKVLSTTNGFVNPKGRVLDKDLALMFAYLDKNYTFSYTSDMAYNFYSDFKLPFLATTNTAYSNSPITRAQFARIYAAFKGLDLGNEQAVQYLYINEISTGVAGVRTYPKFNPTGYLTREDAAVFFYRIAKKERLAVIGLKKVANGKRDNAKITLPPGFTDNTTTEFNGNTSSSNNVVGPDNVNNPLQSITVDKPELIANGVDSTLVQVQFKACNGQPISYDASYAFEVKSKNAVVTTSGSTAKPAGTIMNTALETASTINTDGPTLAFYVVAPKLSKSLKDTILITMKSNTDSNMACFANQTIQVPLTYIPKPELRITYEVYDSDSPDDTQTDVIGEYPPAAEVPVYFKNGKITVYQESLDTDAKKFKISQSNVTYQELGVTKTGEYAYNPISYENASLKANSHPISEWLFGTIIDSLIGESLSNSILIDYQLNSDGQPEYNISLGGAEIAAALQNQYPVITIVELFKYIPAEKDLGIEHYDSVKSIMDIYNNLSGANKNLFLTYNGGKIASALEAANAKVDTLKESADLASRPKDMDRYTKIIVSLVLPGGQIITDYDGDVKISFDGKEQIQKFDKNTSDYLKNTGHAGAAVANFDSIIYGESEVTAEIIKPDTDYSTPMKTVEGKEFSRTIYTDYRFTQNACTNIAEVAFVLDYSSSMDIVDPQNARGKKTMKMIKQLALDNVVQAKFSTKGTVLQTGEYKNFNSNLSYENLKESGATNLVAGIDPVFNKFTGDVNATKSIVLVSDGKSSEKQLQQLLLKAKQQEVKIFTVGMGEKADINEALLTRIAKETGGQFFHVLDNAQLHYAYQTIIDSILCGKVYSSCLNSPTVFNNTKVVMRSGKVIMSTRINTNCTEIVRVAVRYSSISGDVQYDLIKKNDTLYSMTKSTAQLDHFDLYEQVQFFAYNKVGELVSTKTVNVEQ